MPVLVWGEVPLWTSILAPFLGFSPSFDGPWRPGGTSITSWRDGRGLRGLNSLGLGQSSPTIVWFQTHGWLQKVSRSAFKMIVMTCASVSPTDEDMWKIKVKSYDVIDTRTRIVYPPDITTCPEIRVWYVLIGVYQPPLNRASLVPVWSGTSWWYIEPARSSTSQKQMKLRRFFGGFQNRKVEKLTFKTRSFLAFQKCRCMGMKA